MSRSEVIEEAQRLLNEALSTGRGIDPAHALGACDRALVMLTPLGPSELQADVLRRKGNIFRDRGDHGRAMDQYAQSLATADAISYSVGRAHALNCFGTMAQFRGDLQSAVSWYRAAQRLAVRLGDGRLFGMIEQNLGIAAATNGRARDALAHFQNALAAFEHAADEQASLWVLNNLGNLYRREGSYDLAAGVLQRALELARKTGDVVSEGIVEENRSRLLLATGSLDEAQEAATRALEIASKRGDGTRQAAALYTAALIVRKRDPMSPEASAVLERALQLAETGEEAEIKGDILRAMADACAACGDNEQASVYRHAQTDLPTETATPPDQSTFRVEEQQL